MSQKEETVERNGLYSKQNFYQTKIFPVPRCSLEAKLPTYNVVRLYIGYLICEVGKRKVTIVLIVYLFRQTQFFFLNMQVHPCHTVADVINITKLHVSLLHCFNIGIGFRNVT